MESEILNEIQKIKRRLSHLERLEQTMADNYGWIGSAWQKDPIRIGYSDVIRDSASNTNLSAGTNYVDGTTVPAGEIWIITNITFSYIGTVSGVGILPSIDDSGSYYYLCEEDSLTSGHYYDRQGYWILEPGENLTLLITGATATDDVYWYAIGWRVDIDQ